MQNSNDKLNHIQASLQGRSVVEEILEQLNSPSLIIRETALSRAAFNENIDIPEEIIDRLMHDAEPSMREYTLEYLQWHDIPKHRDYLLAALSDAKAYICWKAIRHLARFPDSRAIEPLKAILSGPGESKFAEFRAEHVNGLKRSAILALGYCADNECRLWLLELLKSNTMPAFASDIGGAIGKKPDVSVMEPLIELLKSDQREVVRGAVLALSKIAEQRATEALIATLERYYDDKDIVFWLIPALAKTQDIRALEALLALLKDPRPFIPTYLIPELGNFNNPRVMNELELRLTSDEKHRDGAINALAKIHTTKSMDLLLAGFEREINPRLIWVFLQAFIFHQDARAIPALKRKLKQSLEPRSRKEVSQTLETLKRTTQSK